jgi:hypothetical protein
MSKRVESLLLGVVNTELIFALILISMHDRSYVFAVCLSLMGWGIGFFRRRAIPGLRMLAGLGLVLLFAMLDMHHIMVAAAAGVPLGVGVGRARHLESGSDSHPPSPE